MATSGTADQKHIHQSGGSDDTYSVEDEFPGTYEILLPETTPQRVAKLYDSWAEKYDACADEYEDKFADWTVEADIMVPYLGGNKEARVLDIGCGTGNMGEQLGKLSYLNCDGLDGSQGMLERAERKKLYRNYYCIILEPDTKLPMEDNTYDAVISFDGFIPGHISPDSFDDVIRVVKPGGHIFTVLFESHYKEQNSYTKHLEDTLSKHVMKENWKRLEKKTVPTEMGNEIWFIYQVLSGKLKQ